MLRLFASDLKKRTFGMRRIRYQPVFHTKSICLYRQSDRGVHSTCDIPSKALYIPKHHCRPVALPTMQRTLTNPPTTKAHERHISMCNLTLQLLHSSPAIVFIMVVVLQGPDKQRLALSFPGDFLISTAPNAPQRSIVGWRGSSITSYRRNSS